MTMRLHEAASLLLVVVLGFAVAGCETKAQTGALVGGASGAAIGAGVGSMVHSSAGAGALIGGAVGTVGGYMVGNEMDKADQRERAYQQNARGTRENQYEAAPAGRPVSKNDVINWTRAGERDDVIIDRIQRNGTTFRPTAADENDLRDNNVSEDVIRTMKGVAQ